MLDLNSLAVFVRVAEAGSFSDAAKRLNMPVSTVSRRLADLEARLGVRLLERSTRHVRLTEIGHDILVQCQRGLEAFEDAQLLISNRQAQVRGTLRLSAPPSLTDSHLAPLFLEFRAAYPNVDLEIMTTDRRIDLIADGIDVAIRVGPHEDSTLVIRPLLRFRHLLVATPAYIAAFDAPKDPSELNDHTLAAFGSVGGNIRWTLSDGSEKQSLRCRPAITANEFVLPLRAALRGEAIAEIPAVACVEQLRSGLFVEVMQPWAFPTVDLSILHLGRANMSRIVRVFTDFCVDHVATLFKDLPDRSWAPQLLIQKTRHAR